MNQLIFAEWSSRHNFKKNYISVDYWDKTLQKISNSTLWMLSKKKMSWQSEMVCWIALVDLTWNDLTVNSVWSEETSAVLVLRFLYIALWKSWCMTWLSTTNRRSLSSQRLNRSSSLAYLLSPTCIELIIWGIFTCCSVHCFMLFLIKWSNCLWCVLS